jgi:phosphoglycerate dehydrogenase-like enzyme
VVSPLTDRPTDVVVFCDNALSLARIRERFPALEVVDITKGVPDGQPGDVLYGGSGVHSVAAMAAGVRWVQLVGTGIDGLPPEVRAAPVLTSARGAGAVAISEYVIATMGAFAREFPENWLRQPPDRWFFQPARTLAGATLGLYGFGGIAQRVARIALALEMSVVALRRQPQPSPIPGVEMVQSVADLVSVADHLVLAAPSTELTRQVINDDTIALMRPGLHLVNIARGALVDQEALRRGLDDGPIARASLDVSEPEPLPPDHWLYDHPKVFLTPHSSWVGPPAFAASTELFCDNLDRFLAGQPLLGVVGPDGY